MRLVVDDFSIFGSWQSSVPKILPDGKATAGRLSAVAATFLVLGVGVGHLAALFSEGSGDLVGPQSMRSGIDQPVMGGGVLSIRACRAFLMPLVGFAPIGLDCHVSVLCQGRAWVGVRRSRILFLSPRHVRRQQARVVWDPEFRSITHRAFLFLIH